MKKNKKKDITWWEVLTRTKPKIVIMPILMMIFGIIGCIPYFLSKEQEALKIILFTFVLLLFWFIPTTTIPFVLKKFQGKRKSNLLRRMFITSIPAIILVYAFFTRWRDEILFIYGFLGFLYFFFDYITQGKLSILIETRPDLLKKRSFINGVMSTKCSRSVLWEYSRRIKDTKRKQEIRILMKETGIRWWHLFPLTPNSLTERIFPFLKKIL